MDPQERHRCRPGGGGRHPQRSRSSGRWSYHVVGRRTGRQPDSKLAGPWSTLVSFFSSLSWAFGLYRPAVPFGRYFGGFFYWNLLRCSFLFRFACTLGTGIGMIGYTLRWAIVWSTDEPCGLLVRSLRIHSWEGLGVRGHFSALLIFSPYYWNLREFILTIFLISLRYSLVVLYLFVLYLKVIPTLYLDLYLIITFYYSE